MLQVTRTLVPRYTPDVPHTLIIYTSTLCAYFVSVSAMLQWLPFESGITRRCCAHTYDNTLYCRCTALLALTHDAICRHCCAQQAAMA
jgi:hypothetical protein